MNEKTYVLTSFKNNFSRLISEPIAIYGIGKNTYEIIKAYPEFNIVGLLDPNCIGEIVYNKKILSFDEILEYQIKTIIIIAKNSNLQTIYRRIKSFACKHNIQVYDINGNCLGKRVFETKKLPASYKYIKKEKLYKMVDDADVVSFDIFDTLLMRTCLEPTDIFLEVEKDEKCNFDGFAQKRILAEQILYRVCNPTIYDIYDLLCLEYGMAIEDKEYFLQKEIAAERDCLLPRKEMVSVIQYAKERNKKIYATSDMYLTSEILSEFFKMNDILIDQENIIVSCEYGKSKCSGLFCELKDKNPNAKILHIGDNYEADVVAAEKEGITSFGIRSACKMLEDSKEYELLSFTMNKYERDLIGKFILDQFNNPFLFSKTYGKCQIQSEYQLGYYFIAPVVAYFVKWMTGQTKKNGIKKILLSARDGYLLVRVFDKLKLRGTDFPQYSYFYASRQVCVLAGIKTEEDIRYAASLAFSGTMEQLLRKRFMLSENEVIPRKTEMTDEEYVLLHKRSILKKAGELRARYIKYIDSMDILEPGGNIAYFDFVSSGSCQKGLESILDRKINGIYFVRIEDDYKKNLTIEAFYKDACVYEKQYAIMDIYFFMENVFSSFEPSLSSFDAEGNPIFLEESRTLNQINSLKKIQKGILDAVCDIYEKLPDEITSEEASLPDLFLKYINSKYAKITTDYFKKNYLKDEFCNREFDISANMI